MSDTLTLKATLVFYIQEMMSELFFYLIISSVYILSSNLFYISELLTCGSDGDIRVWSNLEDDDPSSFSVGEWALAINTIDKQLLVSNDSLSIQRYILPQFDKNGIVSRFTAPITHIAISNKASVSIYPLPVDL